VRDKAEDGRIAQDRRPQAMRAEVYRGYKLEIHQEDGAWLVEIAGTGWRSTLHRGVEKALDEARPWIDANKPKVP
jgi:hypothetical protein